MNLESQTKLKFDRRLMRRTNWVEESELAAELEQLPDVSDKIARPDESDSPKAGAGASPAPAGSPGAPAASSLAGRDPI